MTRPADGFTSVLAALARWACARGDDTAFTFLGAGGAVDRVLTYAGLADEVARVAAFVRTAVRPGDRVLLLYPPGADYLAAFLGCLSAGAVAVPLYPPRPGAKLDRITAVVDDCGAALALTTDPLVPLLADLPVPVLATGELPAAPAAPTLPAPADLAFLQYTSGSTGTPKGVMVSHANLAANLSAIEAGFGIDQDDVVLSWLPMYHDMGLIGTTLLPLYTGTQAVLLPTFEFVRDPLCWPLAIAEFGATCSGGPDFAYRLLAERYDPARLSGVDLSRWRIAFNGAEPVRAATMAAVTERYAAQGFSPSAWFPCYGLAEATLFVTGAGTGRTTAPVDGRDIVSSGVPAPDTTVVVVDGDGQPVTGEPGEILVQSPGVARGYWGKPDTTAFHATVPGHTGEFLRTGDLGALVDGALHVTGRVKDLIIVGGRNHHPHDLEAAATGTDPRVRGAAAFQATGGVVLVAELVGAAVRLPAEELAALASAVRRSVSVDCGLDVDEVVFTRPNAILRTSSGKLRRAATRELFEQGQLKTVGHTAATSAPTDLRAVLVEKIGFAVDAADAARPLAALGLDSMKLVALKGAAEAYTGTRLPAELFFGDGSLNDVLTATGLPAQEPVDVPDECAATDSQLQMVFHDQLHPDDRSNTLSTALRLARPFEADEVRAAVAATVAAHPALRTTIRDGHQHVHDDARFDWVVTECAAETDGTAFLTHVAGQPFDLADGPLVRAAVVLTPASTTLLVACHHAVADYVSLRVVLTDVVAHLLGDKDFALTDGTAADPRAWTAEQARLLATPAAQARLADLADRWRPARNEVLFPAPPAPQRRRNPAAVVDFVVDADRTTELYARSAARGTTAFVTVAAAYLRALHRVTGNPAVTIGTTHHGRTDTRFANTVGYLVNPVPLRADFADGDRFADVENRTRAELRDALRTADLPFAALVRALAPDRHGQNPLFQATLTYQQSADGRLGDGFAIPSSGAHATVAGVGVSVVDVPPSDVAFALSLYGARDGDRTVYRLVYQRDLVGEAVALRVVDEFRLALDEALGRQDDVVEDVAAPTLGWATNLSAGFARSVELYGDRTAIRCGDESLTYRELEERVAALAGTIAARSTSDGATVGILLDRSIDMVVAALAVVRAGAAYVPVDPSTPVARTALILADAAPALVLTSAALADRVGTAAPVVLVDESVDLPPLPAEACRAGWDTPAYVIFTSGTTGRPKGVQVSHGNLVRLFTATEDRYGFGPDDVWTLFHSFAFDFSVWEMWGALLYGGCVVVVPRDVATDPAAFRALLRDERVTVLNQTPTAFTQLIAEDARHPDRLPLRHVVFGGEALRFADLRRWVAKYGDTAPRLVNMYGITETTVHASYRPVVRADLDRTDSPVGVPLSDLDFVLVDGDLNPVPAGETGELVVTGPGVALGYLNRPDLTAERFVTVGGVRGYRSGDLAVRTEQGEYVYLGRGDDQVKIRGFRIELGEIQAALTGAPGVRQAAVVVDRPATAQVVAKRPASVFRLADTRELVRGATAQPPGTTGPRIIAYVVGEVAADDVFAHLHTSLPGYMVPACVVAVEKIPLNHNGKVDTGRLPAPTAANALRVSTADDVVASPAERRMCALFEEVLGTTGVRPDDSFFAIGGDSIVALRLRSAALAHGVAIELADIYALQTPRAIAAAAGTPPEEAAAPVAPFAQLGPDDRALVPHGVVDAYPVSTLQAGFLFHSAYQTDVNMYCDIFMFTFGARYDHAAMRAVVDRAVAKHEMLRTSFDFTRYSEPLQLVHDTAHLPLTHADLRHLDEDARQAELDAWCAAEKQTPYDWATPPLVRFAVHVLTDDTFRFAMSFHDATLDGWSESVMMTGILTEYWALLHDRPLDAVEPPARRYADFIAAEREVLSRPSAREFWAREMADVVPTPLPSLASGARDIHDGRMGFLSVDLPADVSLRLDDLAGELRVSLKHVLVAVHARVQALLSGQAEVVVGIVSNGRVAEEGGTDALGVHINVVPFRLSPTGRTWTELAHTVLAKDTELLATRGFPYAEIRQLAGAGGDLFDVSFNFTHFHGYERLAAATGIEVLDARAYMQTSFALRVELNKDPFTRLLSIDLEANMERVGEAQLHRIGEAYRNALEHVVTAPEQVPTNRDLLGEDTYRQLLAASRGPVLPLADDGFLATFAKSVAAHPDRVAAVCGDDAVTYAELAARVAAGAGWLAARGVRPGDVVALRAGRDLGYLVALMAVMRVGAVYLPLPAGPASRVASMLRRGKAVLVLHDDTSADLVREAGVDTALVADIGECAPYTGPLPGGRDGAYIIFTSGSTGEPKGALIRHDGMLNHVLAKVGVLGIAAADRVSQDAAATFDISLWQWFSPLAVGATTVIYPDEISQDPPRLLRAVAEDGITVLEVAPSVLSVFCAELAHYGVAAYPPFALRWVASSGETLKPGAANEFRRLLPDVRLLNMWGITETSDDTTHHEVKSDVDERLPSVAVGTPIENTAVYVLDGTGQPVPDGTPGELYVGGVAVCAGYVNDPDRTAAAFVPDPFEPDATLYKTGDRGRVLADGSLEFLGRVDRQLKIRGQRVELGEVEAALAAVPGVGESAVVVRTDDGANRLAGFFVARTELSTADIRAVLTGVLPRYAVPDFLVGLDELPRTPHGKVDTKALQRTEVLPALEQAAVEPPATATEATVLDVIGAVLKIGAQDPTADFFELGGHSLHATHVMARLRDRFGVQLPLRLLFEHPTARGVAAAIDEALGDWRAEEVTAHGIPDRPADLTRFPLTLNQASLWFLHQVDPDDRAYDNLSLLRLRGPLDVAALRSAVGVLVRRHEVLTARFGDQGGVPYQTPAPGAPVELEVLDATGVPADQDAVVAHIRAQDHRFDLARGPLAVARLHRFGPEDHVFEWRLHHIVTDGWSSDVAMREIREAYLACLEGRAPDLPELRVQYADYARWQEDFLATHAQPEENFWKSYLDGYGGVLDVATTYPRTPDRAQTAGYATHTWDRATAERIAAFAAARQVTPFILGHAVTAVLMAKAAQQSDVVVGAVVAGRTVPETEQLIGFFANTLPLRYSVDVTATPAAVLSAVADSAVSALENQLLPFGRIVEASGVGRTPGMAPLMQVLTTFDNFPFDMAGLPGLTSTLVQVPQETSRFDLLFRFVEWDGLELTIQYDATLFSPAAAAQLLDGVVRLLDFFVTAPDRPLTEAVLCGDETRTALAALWRDLTGTGLVFDATTADTVLASEHAAEFLDLADRRGLLTALLLAL